ncbi:hypothetical protein Rleg10DRAFT_6123 [Rhizobium leguminosarum bv. trifolii WSM2012]|nr:hypothetical protein Rleg10DRAFT_6123 [Rhizobium leguminosarum bv. trifolii WSM2012]
MMLSNSINPLCAGKGQRHFGSVCGPLEWSMFQTAGAVRP